MNKQVKLIIVALFVVQLISLASALTISSVSSSPNSVEPGKKVSINIVVENNDETIENVDVVLKLDNVPFAPQTSSESHVDKIKADKSESFEFGLIAGADAEAGVYKIPLTITYQLNNQTQVKNSVISLEVNAKPALEVNANGFVLKNQKNKVTLQITNKGLAKAKFLEVDLGTGNYDLLSANKVYIGDLNSNDFDSVSFDIFVKGDSSLSLPVTLTYRDASNNVYNENSMVSVKAYSNDEAIKLGLVTKSNTGVYVIVIVVLIILYVVYRKIKKWRKKKNNSGSK